jgi:PHD/YefM family antitoxin component YafN of YafNO toxin-antitoxin module
MVIKPSATMRDNYREIADYCIETGQPIFLTNNGEGELVVMSIQAWEEERRRFRIEETLLKIEDEENSGITRYTNLEQFFAGIDRIIDDAEANVT